VTSTQVVSPGYRAGRLYSCATRVENRAHELCINHVDPRLVKLDNYHSLLIINIYLPFATYIQNYVQHIRTINYHIKQYILLYNILYTYDWSCLYGTTSVSSTAASLNTAVQGTMEQAIPRSIINCKSKFLHWYSGSLYIRKKNYFYIPFKNPVVFTKILLSIVRYLKRLLSLTDLGGLNLLMKI
jgi:hypothetical protein